MDIDIDLQSTFNPSDCFDNCVVASNVRDGELVKHNVGVYFQNIAKDPFTGLAAIPYKQAEELGYFKFDFLHLSLLDYFGSKEQIRKLIKVPPDWSMLERQEVVEKLFQLHNHYDLIHQIKPRSIQELADCVALIRPGKRKQIPIYLKNKELCRVFLYTKGSDPSSFKKGHAICYALNIVLQLHLIKGKIL